MTSPQEPTPTPDLPPYPYGGDDGSPMWPEGSQGPDGTWQVPQYPPYIPESEFDTSQGSPRSTLDGVHGTEDDMGYWSPSYPGELPPYWTTSYKEIAPGVWKKLGPGDVAPGQVRPAGNAAQTQGPSGNPVFHVNYRQLEGMAQNHDQQSDQVAQWAGTEPDFADRFLATHGKVAYASYLNVKGYNDSRQAEAGAYAQRNADTAVALRGSIESTRSTDEGSAAAFRSPTTNT